MLSISIIPSGILSPLGVWSASSKTRELCALPSQPAKTCENFKSNVMAANTFCVVPSFRPRNLSWILIGTDARI